MQKIAATVCLIVARPGFRRKSVAALGALAFLALSGSQSMTPVSLAFTKAGPEPQEGQSYYYDAMWSGVPEGTQIAPIAPAAAVTSTAPKPFGFTTPATLTSSGIPEAAYRAYVNAATELSGTDPTCRLNWSVIAGIGRVESNHGRFGGSSIQPDGLVTPPILGIRLDGSRAGTARISDSDGGKYDGDPVFDRAVGPMQFLPGTWKTYGGGGNPQNMNAAALATGKYLCAGDSSLDTQAGRWAAVYRYNHSDSYVSLVLSLADSYASGKVVTFPTRPSGTPAPDDSAPTATPPGPPPSLPPVPPAATTPAADPTAFPVGGTSPPVLVPPRGPIPTRSATPSPTASGSPTGVPSDQDPPSPSDSATTAPAGTTPATTAPTTTVPAAPSSTAPEPAESTSSSAPTSEESPTPVGTAATDTATATP
jgi:hypothetical protein